MAGSAFAVPSLQKVGNAVRTPEGLVAGPRVEKKASTAARVKANAADGTQTMDWSYAGDPVSAYSLKNVKTGMTVYLAFKMSAEDATKLAGNKITAINVTSGTSSSHTNLVKKVFPFISKDITKEEFDYKGSMAMGSKEFTVNTHTLTDPYEIKAGEELYIGYYFGFLSTMSSAYYMPVDMIPTENGIESCIYGYSKMTDYPTNFENGSNEIGSLCVSITLEGNNLPQNVIGVTGSAFPTYSKPGEKYVYELSLWNRGAAEVKTVSVTTVTGNTTETSEVTLDKALASGERCDVEIEGKADETGISLPIAATVGKVNGQDNESTANRAEGYINVYPEGYPHKILMEEATGTWCGYCPAGMTMMDYIKKNLADDFIIIAAHYDDTMQCDSYLPFMQTYVGGFPFAIFNRTYGMTPSYMQSDTELYDYSRSIAALYKEYPAYAKIDLTGSVDESKGVVDVTAKGSFLYDTEVPHYFSYAIVEDGIEGMQTNGYSGSGIQMGGWQNRPGKVKVQYEDVARELVGFPGVENSLPAKITANTEYEHSVSIPLKNVDTKNFRIIGFLTNGATGEVVNSVEIPFEWSSVDSIEVDGNAISVDNGNIIANGTDVKVFTLDGRRVASNGLSNGIYIVVCDGKAAKIAVK